MKKGILLILGLFVVLCVGIVYGAATFINPTDGAIVTLAEVVQNFSVRSTLNVTNCTLSGSSALTGDSFLYLFNATRADATLNVSNVSSILADWVFLEDSTDWALTGTCYNGTDCAACNETITPITVTVDLAKPSTPSSLSPATGTESTNRAQTFSATVGDSTTTSCALIFRGATPGSPSYTATYSASSCTHSLTNIADGVYNWYIQASDGTNTTDSVLTSLQIHKQEGGGAQIEDTCDDVIRNQDETDIDCGGKICAKCVNGQQCLINADCASSHCNLDSVCSAKKSITTIEVGGVNLIVIISVAVIILVAILIYFFNKNKD